MYINKIEIDTKSLNLQSTFSVIPDNLFFTSTFSFPMASTENPLISLNETLIMVKLTNPSTDNQTT